MTPIGKTIVLVEDNATNRKLVRDVLRWAGYEVHEAEEARRGLDLVRDLRPDLVCMDIQLPGMDGLTAIRALRADEATRDIPIVAITAHAMAGDEAKMLAAGCDAYMAKPIHYKQLLETVGRLVGGRPEKPA